MKSLNKHKNKIILIPEILKDCRLKVKFCYFALRNLLYYVSKGMKTQMKSDRELNSYTINVLMDNYFKCIDTYNLMNEEETNLIRKCFSEKNIAIMPKNDYSLAVEKELTFKKFAFYCNCLIELSFHVGESYFNDDYIIQCIKELSEKMLVQINNTFVEFIVDDVNDTLRLIDSI